MFSFTLGGHYFFDREALDGRWYAYTSFATPPVRQAYFSLTDGRFLDHACDDRFTPAEIATIERHLYDNVDSMNAEQFEPHFRRPDHYRLMNPSSNRHADIMRRLRVYGEWDINTSVALDVLCTINPAFRLTREFVVAMLDHASQVSEHDHDEWLREVAMDHWTYDLPDPRSPFDAFFLERKKSIYLPDATRRFNSDEQELYTIEGLPSMYYLEENTEVQNWKEPIIDYRHFVDLGSVVAPVALPGPNHKPCYIL